ncbi:MAG: LPS export ABC transporter periplasmic protein LptC [Nostoc sp. DedQUE08]|uniref:LPS export ABC transporter periplasmic protein LptC n=1 Tax=unclassified Nostoc TaxID=2593658 RepID=UPI002AD4F976|nr:MULTISPECIES: LPS export ABC transporter periplasmic protein LptC [unclassified Nostoc]MDZ8033496.1 LPS export ABC transporter periplasmic protein LptC [Nostoc sp. DedSLP04]MDZ8067826.1 LPS export ABC transporter periplasmic protein LptC [Nostoc sp. DedQUE08]MDZ8090744.1 LPS export ABC transporter periplasmic protein LptC [Nostoc sp. DedQUE05]MDZ8136963.1 LPS export ABC transporter periplasmic protein LptC [Nostoc sp. DedQUE04]
MQDFSSTPSFLVLPLTFLLVFALVACGGKSPPASQQNTADSSNKDSNLTFFDVTLEQADEVGRPIWKVRAKTAKYTKEKQIGQAESPYGELYQDGKIVYQIKADVADIEQDGKQLFLKGKIFATDPSNGIVLQGNELEWRPKEDLLIVRNKINGSHKKLQAVAQEVRVKTREQRMEFSGGVVANSIDPQMQVRTEHLIWNIKEEKLIGDRPLEIDRYKDNKISDRGKGNSAEVNLKTKIATIQKNAQLDLLDPPMQIASNSMTWNMNAETVTTNSPTRMFQRAENVTVTANQGEMKIPQKTVYLKGNVNAVGQRRQSLRSNTLTWYLDNKLVEAQGNVVYRQIDPPLNFVGETAVGNLQTENIVVKGGSSSGRVVTEIIPQERANRQQ